MNGTEPRQLELLPAPPLRVQWPNPETFAHEALMRMLHGERITQPSFGPERAWRLAAYIFDLTEMGWPVRSTPVADPGRSRPIAEYWLPRKAIRAARAMRKGAKAAP
jgi:hypothetical protein